MLNGWQLLAMLILLIFSALFSGSESAFFSLRPTELNAARRRLKLADRVLLKLHADLGDFLYTILFGNLVVNITYFAFAASQTSRFQERFGSVAAAVGAFFFLAVIIVCGEVLPKNLGSSLCLPIARAAAMPLYFLHHAMTPLRFLLKKNTLYFERAFFAPTKPTQVAENLRRLFEHYHHEGAVTFNEYQLINAVIELNDIRAREMMTPRIEVTAISSKENLADALAMAREKKRSKIIVVDDAENWLGYVDVRDFFFAENSESATAATEKSLANKAAESTELLAHLKPLLIVSEFANAEKTLRRFLDAKIALAAVVDERGCEIGIIALTDIIAEIFGEFGDGTVVLKPMVVKNGNGDFVFDGRVAIRELRDIFKAKTQLPGVSSIGGLVTALIGRTPKVGDSVEFDGINFTVEEITRRRPSRILISTPKKSESTRICQL